MRDAVKDAIVAEALAAKTAMLVLMVCLTNYSIMHSQYFWPLAWTSQAEQKKLLLELKKVEERVSKRDDSILQDLRNIRTSLY